MPIIETKNLTKTYGKNRGIEGVTLTVEEGDFFGFIGPNGAGKSTTIRVLLGLISPTSGSARVFGKDCARDTEEILRNVGYMPSETQFYHGMRVSETIRYAARLFGDDYAREADALCKRFDVDTRKKIEDLSFGNRRKVSIVCAFQHSPKLIILDEPTSGLDPLMQHEFYALLAERHATGATIFMSSHVLSEVQRYCKHAAIVREGKLIVSDSVEKLSETNVRRVRLEGISTTPDIVGLKDIQAVDGSVSFLYSGDPKALIAALQGLPLTDITITEPSFDEVFLHFYKQEGE